MSHCREIADARFEHEHELGANAENFGRVNADHMNLADEVSNLRHAFMAAMVGICTVAMVGLMLLFVSYGGPKIIEKIAHQIEQVQP